MTTSYYDVVVVGMDPAAVLGAALLAKRGFRVLVLGHDDLPPSYEMGGIRLTRAPYTFLAGRSPVARRMLSELALHQAFRRRAVTMDPMLQVALPGHRMDLPSDPQELEQEVEREFPSVKRPIEDFHRHVLATAAELDRLVERDLVWPPETFFERRELARAAAYQSFDRRGEGPDPLAELPEEHPFRLAVRAPVSFAGGMDPEQGSALRTARLYAAWLRDPAKLEGGYATLLSMLLDKITTHGGEVRERERADRVLIRRGHATGVRIDGSGDEVGCGFVVAGCDLSSALRLLPDRRPFEELFERIGEPMPRYFRYTLNVVLASEGVPEGMARDVFHVRDARKPLTGANMLRIEAGPPDDEDRRVLCVEALVPRRGVEDVHGYAESLREELLDSLSDLVPFLREHLLLVDSPHDGRDGQDLREGRLLPPSEPWTRGTSTMEAIYAYPVTSTLGVCALPVRTPIRRLLLCNGQVAPGLGQEGAFLAAWSAARIVTRNDRRKEWMRRGLWTKVEI